MARRGAWQSAEQGRVTLQKESVAAQAAGVVGRQKHSYLVSSSCRIANTESGNIRTGGASNCCCLALPVVGRWSG